MASHVGSSSSVPPVFEIVINTSRALGTLCLLCVDVAYADVCDSYVCVRCV